MNNKGFGILQAIVVVGMITASGLYLFARTTNAQKEIRSSLYRQEILVYIDRLQDTLADSRVCTLVAGGKSFGQEIIAAEDSEQGLIVAKDQLIGSNSAFKIDRITLERRPNAFANLRLHLSMKDELQSGSLNFKTFIRDIPLFAQIAGNTVVDCYYDPGDDNYDDRVPNGIISRAIRRVCSAPAGANLIGAFVDDNTMKCHVPGFNPQELPNISNKNFVASGVVPTNSGKQITFLSRQNQYWLPGKKCAAGFLEAVLPNGGIRCREMIKDDIESSVSTAAKDCVGKGIKLKRVNGSEIGVECF